MVAKGKINAAGIANLVAAGTPVRVLVETGENGAIWATDRKTGTESVTIVAAEAFQTPGGWHRTGRVYSLTTRDGRVIKHAAPTQTFIETEQTPAAIKRAHIEALTINEVVDEERAKELETIEEPEEVQVARQVYAAGGDSLDVVEELEARQVGKPTRAQANAIRWAAGLDDTFPPRGDVLERTELSGWVDAEDLGRASLTWWATPAGLIAIGRESDPVVIERAHAEALTWETGTETPAEIDSAEELTLNSQDCKVDTNSTDEPEGDEMSTETATTETRTAPMEHTGSTVVALIERVWDRIRADHPELPRVVVTTGSGEFVKWGHFRPDSWKSGDEKLHEFFLASEALAKGAVQVLQTTIHEAAHTLARVRGQKDTSRQNRYHNKVFLTIAEELGLEHKASTPDKTHGFSFVTLTEATKERYADLLEELTKELVLTGLLPFWLGGEDEEDEKGGEKITKPKGEEDEEGKGKAQTGNLKAVCGCSEPNIIRLSRKVLDKGIVRCDECEELFRAE